MKLKPQALAAILACMLASALGVDAQVLQTLCSFNYTNGDGPMAGLTLGNDGNFYGTTQYGGSGLDGSGTVFQLTTNGTLTTLASFNGVTEGGPVASLTLGNDGNFYGTTEGDGGGNGTVFQLKTNGTLTTLVLFNEANGSGPLGGLTLGNDGNFYGTTAGDGNVNGTVFQMTTYGTVTTLDSFSFTNGATPRAGLALGPDGKFYGTTWTGGANALGTVFQVATNGSLTTLMSFNGTNGEWPMAALTLGSDGRFYGTTDGGGAYSEGTVFAITTNGALSTLASFNGSNGSSPQAALALGPDGNFYGTASAGSVGSSYYGTVFKVTPAGTLTTLAYFDRTNGANPHSGLTLGPDGNFYGTTYFGGSNNQGTVFRLMLPPVVRTTLDLQLSGGNVQLNLAGATGNNYAVQYTTNLLNPNWVDLLSLTNLQTSPVSFLDPAGVVPTGRFYRAITQ